VALSVDDLPVPTAGTLGRSPHEVEAALRELLGFIEGWLDAASHEVLGALRERDALLDRPVAWNGGEGVAAGIDDGGALVVRRGDGSVVALDAGEVHLRTAAE
jgi:biotin-(acetyl-CoA carboxylase) ligase